MEFNVIEQIKNYWNKVTSLSGNKHNEEFANATSEHSVRITALFEWSKLSLYMWIY